MVLGYKILHPSKSTLVDDKKKNTTQDHGQLCTPGSFIGTFYAVVTYLPVDDESTIS